MMWLFSTILTQQLASASLQWSSNSSIVAVHAAAVPFQVSPRLLHQVSLGDHSSRYNGAAPIIAIDESGLSLAPNGAPQGSLGVLASEVNEDVSQKQLQSLESTADEVELDDQPIEPVPMHPLDTGSNYESAADQVDTDTFSEGYRTLAIATAAAMPIGLTTTGLVWYLQKKKDSGKNENVDRNGGRSDDESSMGETTEDAFESKFEVGADAIMWAHQADFSAF
eukprot:Protomagalhaensia_wolfi_Nauph_80__1468@NODE_188_length_3243_cov_282_066792_g141_i0_p3_GENE_NODE_188_length_3243_cov_282_066792_g141_i0NODE_188_length_3243_cov_282_066792_g141_i0_p3_ORF_typecomplete_len224_score34_46_NODE_188_length_3243_cov_282_066792_g141_i025413212